MTIYSDSLSAIELGNKPVFHECIKHIEIDCHFIRDEILSGIVAYHMSPSISNLLIFLPKDEKI